MGGHRASGAGDDLVDGPVDLAAVRADDALLDALAGGAGFPGPRQGEGEYGDDEHLAALLASWRADIEADPMPELVTLDEALEAVTAGHEARERVEARSRRRMPFAIAAAAAVIAFAGLTVAVHGAMPGDTLWGVSKVFFSERAEGVERVETVRSRIDEANQAIARGDTEAARSALNQVDIVLPQVQEQDQAPLVQQRDRVRSSLDPTAPKAPAPAPAPAPSRPNAPAAGGGEDGTSAPEDATTVSPSPVEPPPPSPKPEDSATTAPEETAPREAPAESSTTTNGMSSPASPSGPAGTSTTG